MRMNLSSIPAFPVVLVVVLVLVIDLFRPSKTGLEDEDEDENEDDCRIGQEAGTWPSCENTCGKSPKVLLY
jgi:hypothetical protein